MKKTYLLRLLMALMVLNYSACSKDDDDNTNSNNSESSSSKTSQDLAYEQLLSGTSWQLTRHYTLNDDGTKKDDKYLDPGITTFADNNVWYGIGINGEYDSKGNWEVENGGVEIYPTQESKGTHPAVVRVALLMNGYLSTEIQSITNSQLKTRYLHSTGEYSYSEFKRVTYREVNLDNNNGNGGSGGSSGDKPYVTSFDFTATKSSITVKFMCSERPTSATVKYGTSSPSSTASSSIAGKQVSATVSGLKSGTKYYFKCTVSNSYGSSTSDTFSAMTNY